MKFHEYANLFPMMPETDLMRLAEDIKEKGQSDPVITLDGMILDGRNRYKACEINGITPRCEEYSGDDPLGFVISHNLHRRHLTESQRGMVAAKMANLKHGQRSDRQDESIDSSKIPDRKEAGEMLNVGEATVTRAKKIQRIGSPELNAAVESGEVTIGAAYKVAELPHEEQRELVNAGVEAVKAKAKEIRDTPKHEEDEPEPVVVDGTQGDEPQPARRPPIKIIEDEGMNIWLLAKSHLDRINKHDTQREQALKACADYCNNRLNSKK